MEEVNAITVPVKVDLTDLREAVSLAHKLVSDLEKANRLLNQLTSHKD